MAIVPTETDKQSLPKSVLTDFMISVYAEGFSIFIQKAAFPHFADQYKECMLLSGENSRCWDDII